MNKRELSQLYFLNREIEEQQRRLEELEVRATSGSQTITSMPRIEGISDRVARYATEIADLKQKIEVNLRRCMLEHDRLNQFIEEVEDCELRMILAFRYVNGLTWEQVAVHIDPDATGDGVRIKRNRFLRGQ